MDDLVKLAHAFLVADEVLAQRKGRLRSSIFGIEIVSDVRMPPDVYALGSQEGAVVVRDAADFARAALKAVAP